MTASCSGCATATPTTSCSGAWLAKESVRDIYLTDDPKDAECSSTRPSSDARDDEVEEIRSLGDTLERWRTEILNHHRTGASNGPTEGLNLCVKKVKRAGRGFTCFEHYRLRVLLHAGGVTWPRRPSPPRIRTRSPHSTRRAFKAHERVPSLTAELPPHPRICDLIVISCAMFVSIERFQ